MAESVPEATGGANAGRDERSREVALLDVGDVATLLSCSQRHVYRLADAGRMPAPIHLGALVRWSRDAVTTWIDNGCPPVRNARKEVR